MKNAFSFKRIASYVVGASAATLFVFFLTGPFASVNAEAFPRWALFLAALDGSEFLNFVWFGNDLPSAPLTGERFSAFGIGLIALLAAGGLGGIFFNALKRFAPSFKANIFETIFFSVGIGLALFAAAFSWRSESGAAAIATIFFAASALYFPFRKKRREASTASNLPIRLASVVPVPLKTKQVSKTILSESSFLSLPFSTRFEKGFAIAQLLLATLFASFYLFAATQPLYEYDALEYHAQAAREIYETNSYPAPRFSTTNVYANMPLGAETFYIWGFRLANAIGYSPENVLRIGVLAGKTVLAGVALLTALGIFAFAVRFLNDSRAGIFAAIFYLSFPNVFDVFSNGLNDGALGFALFATFYAFLIFCALPQKERLIPAIWFALFVGFAVSIKYTGVVFVALPAFFGLCVATFFDKIVALFKKNKTSFNESVCENSKCAKRAKRPAKLTFFAERIASISIFVALSTLATGSWFVRNFAATGNPVYPLAFKVFGDSSGTWNADVDARWTRAHSTSDHRFAALAESIARSSWRDDLASPFFPFVPIVGISAFYVAFRRREKTTEAAKTARILAVVFSAFFIFWLGWHFATHRLTRFLVPAAPLAALLLGAGAAFVLRKRSVDNTFEFNGLTKATFLAIFAFGLCWCGLEIDVRAPGRLAPLRALERDSARLPQASIYFNDRPRLFAESSEKNGVDETNVTASRKLLLVGEAKAFAYRIPILYSTCWNRSPLIPLLDEAVERDANGQITAILDAAKIRVNFQTKKIAFVLVDFAELTRFRSPGNYGFCDAEIDENLFRLLVAANVLEPFAPSELRDRLPESTQIFRVVAPR